jgi:hypothetical protein
VLQFRGLLLFAAADHGVVAAPGSLRLRKARLKRAHAAAVIHELVKVFHCTMSLLMVANNSDLVWARRPTRLKFHALLII